jgi:hypothetical protein
MNHFPLLSKISLFHKSTNKLSINCLLLLSELPSFIPEYHIQKQELNSFLSKKDSNYNLSLYHTLKSQKYFLY